VSAPHDPGGKRVLSLPDGTKGGAIFRGDNDEYRVALVRQWDITLPSIMFGMMNPSEARADIDDPTIAKVCGFARRWGFGTAYISNIHAYRCTDQMRLTEVADPVGPGNDEWIMNLAIASDRVVLAYGTPKHKALRARGPQVARMLIAAGIKPHVFKLSVDGVPYHPLYLPNDTKTFEWSPDA